MAEASRLTGWEVFRNLASVGPCLVEASEADLKAVGRRAGVTVDRARDWRGKAERRKSVERIDILFVMFSGWLIEWEQTEKLFYDIVEHEVSAFSSLSRWY